MNCKQLYIFLIRKALCCCITILWSSSAISFSSTDNPIVISDRSDCLSADYEAVKEKIKNFQDYHSIDDSIDWSDLTSELLSQSESDFFQALSNFPITLRILDMTVSLDFPQDSEDPKQRNSRVWMAFSPLGLPREFKGIYPKIPLSCSVVELEDKIVHNCDQVEGFSYAIRSFSSDLEITRGNDCITSSYDVRFLLDLQHIDTIYREIVRYRRWPDRFLYQFDKRRLFSLYFEHFYNQFINI